MMIFQIAHPDICYMDLIFEPKYIPFGASVLNLGAVKINLSLVVYIKNI